MDFFFFFFYVLPSDTLVLVMKSLDVQHRPNVQHRPKSWFACCRLYATAGKGTLHNEQGQGDIVPMPSSCTATRIHH